ncbi:hypothetical protein ACVWXO_008161 [Bradyrhizobium sp. LM2.7]
MSLPSGVARLTSAFPEEARSKQTKSKQTKSKETIS